MLGVVGHESLEALMSAAVPGGIRTAASLDLPAAATEEDVAAELRGLAARNRVAEPMIGLGYHGTLTPPVIRRNVLEDPSWYTAYTPYQPEISQGRLEALLNFQTVVGDLTGLPTANASLLDEGTAAAEAMTLVRRGPGQPARRTLRSWSTAMRSRRPSRWSAPGPRPWASTSSWPTWPRACRTGELSGVLAAVPGRLRPDPRPAPGRRGRPRRGTRWSSWPPTCSP